MRHRSLLAATLACVSAIVDARADDRLSPTIFQTSVLGESGLRGSKFRHVGRFSAALAASLKACGRDHDAATVPLDGTLNVRTAKALRSLAKCPGMPAEVSSGNITETVWGKLLPDVPAPGPFERAFVATLTLEGTDYDSFEWNYTASDPTAWGTWGPYGATIGQGAEIQAILKSVDDGRPASIVRQAFEAAARQATLPSDEPSPSREASRRKVCATPAPGPSGDYDLFAKVSELRDAAAGEALRTAYCDDRRFGIWIRAFRILGADGRVRKAYDAVYFAPGHKVAHYIDLTRAAYADAAAVATEIDLAMGMDGQTQASVRADRRKVADAVSAAGPAASPALRRSFISERLPVGARNRRDRCARDAVFFIDALASLPARTTCTGPDWDIRSAWRDRAGFSIAAVGLKDTDGTKLAPGWTFDFDRTENK